MGQGTSPLQKKKLARKGPAIAGAPGERWATNAKKDKAKIRKKAKAGRKANLKRGK